MRTLRLVLPVILLLTAVAVPAQKKPTALVFEHVDRWTHARGARHLLEAAGFSVHPLPAGAPERLTAVDLVLFGSFSSESRDYKAWITRHRQRLLEFMQAGGVVMQFTQADQTESVPPLLPEGLEARRGDRDFSNLIVLEPDHPLLKGLPLGKGTPKTLVLPRHLKRPASWESLEAEKGFRILLTSDVELEHPAFLEGAVGRGRLLLTSLFLDKVQDSKGKPKGPPAIRKAAGRFFQNLAAYVLSVRAGTAPAVKPTPEYVPPPPLPFVRGSWTLVMLPDTQVYVMRYPHIFDSQTRWIVKNRRKHNIAFVLHVGDIVNNNNLPQWKHARNSLRILDGKVPYALAPGNHDFGTKGRADTRETMFNLLFPLERARKQPTFGGVFEADRLDNSYHLFSAGGVDWITLALEFGPRDEVVAWAGRVLEDHPDRQAVLATHAYLYSDDTRYDHRRRPDQHWNPYRYGVSGQSGGVNDGEDLWQKLVSRHANMAFVVSGHVLNDGLGLLSSQGRSGRTVHQMLANYQMKNQGGDGYLRLLEFLPGNRRIQVKTYSPYRNRYKTDPQNQFVLEWKPEKADHEE